MSSKQVTAYIARIPEPQKSTLVQLRKTIQEIIPNALVIPELEKELANYKTSKGALQFPINKPLPKALVRKLIATRLRILGETK